VPRRALLQHWILPPVWEILDECPRNATNLYVWKHRFVCHGGINLKKSSGPVNSGCYLLSTDFGALLILAQTSQTSPWSSAEAWPLYVELCSDMVLLESDRWQKSSWVPRESGDIGRTWNWCHVVSMFQIWNVSDVSDVSSGLMTFECLSMFINVYQCFKWFHSGAISTNCCALWGWFHFSGRPSKNQKHHRHFWTNPWCFSAAFGNAHSFFFKSHLREIRVRSCNLLLQARMDALMAVWAKTPMYVLPEKWASPTKCHHAWMLNQAK